MKIYRIGSNTAGKYRHDPKSIIAVGPHADGRNIEFEFITPVPGGETRFKVVFEEDNVLDPIFSCLNALSHAPATVTLSDFSKAELLEELSNRIQED